LENSLRILMTFLTFAIIDSNVGDSKRNGGGGIMSSIDLVILGILLKNPQSAYDIQKNVEYHNLTRWTKISVPSIYRKVIQLNEKEYLSSNIVKGNKFADKAIYSISDKGRAYFEELMSDYANQEVSFLLDFNVVITNLNKMDKQKALNIIEQLRANILNSAKVNEGYAEEYDSIPLMGRTIFEQQKLLYHTLLDWVDTFETQFKKV